MLPAGNWLISKAGGRKYTGSIPILSVKKIFSSCVHFRFPFYDSQRPFSDSLFTISDLEFDYFVQIIWKIRSFKIYSLPNPYHAIISNHQQSSAFQRKIGCLIRRYFTLSQRFTVLHFLSRPTSLHHYFPVLILITGFAQTGTQYRSIGEVKGC